MKELKRLADNKDIVEGKAYLNVTCDSALAQRIFASTKKTGRTFIVPAAEKGSYVSELCLSVELAHGSTPYGGNEAVQCLIPESAEKHAAYISNQLSFGHVWFARPNPEEGQMQVHPCGLGFVNYLGYGIIVGRFITKSRARGVRRVQKSSNENETKRSD